MIKTSSVHPRKTSVTFRNVRNMFGNHCLAFGQRLKNLRKSSESVGKSSQNRQKNSSLVCLSNKQNNTWVHVDMEFLFLCSTWYLSSECSERLRSSWTREQKFHIYVQLCVILCLSFYLLSRLQISCLFPMLWFFLFFSFQKRSISENLDSAAGCSLFPSYTRHF